MSNTKHTKRPWECITREESDGIWSYIGPVENKTDDIAKIDTCNEQRLADAHLIAAAPEMFNALIEAREAIIYFIKKYTDEAYQDDESFIMVDAAIAKAKGED